MKLTFVLFVMTILCFSCQQKPDKEELKKEILAIHHNLIKAHLEKNPEFFIQNMSDDFVSIKKGDILHPDKEEIQTSMTDYINNTTFTEYKDLQEPIIGLSDDGTVAWCIVQVLVQGERKLTDGTFREIDFTCAWMTLYRKTENGWVTEVEASTFK